MWLLAARIYLTTGTQYLAGDYIRTSGVMYEGRIQSFGHIERSISAPAGPARTGDCLVRVDDHDQRFRGLFATHTGIRRLLEIIQVEDEVVLGGFDITNISFGDGYIDIRGTDPSAKWMDRPIPGLINRTNFPWLIEGVDEAFLPIIFGSHFSTGGNPQGMIRCPHMGPTTTSDSPSIAVDRYGVARHTLFLANDDAIVYRKLRSEATFLVVDPAEYNLSQTETFSSNGVTYQPTFLDFYELQEADAEIRIDTHGINHTLASQFSDTQILLTRYWGFPTPLRNPIDLLLLVMFDIIQSIGGDNRPERYNATALEAVRAYCETNSLFCDAAITEPVTAGAVIARLQTSFEFDVFMNRTYQYDAAMVAAEDTGRDVLKDTADFKSITPRLAELPVNRFRYHFALNTASGEWGMSETYDNESDQEELGNATYQGNTDQFEAELVELHYVSDPDVALATIQRRAAVKALGSHRATFVVPTPEWFERLELDGLKGITHYGGIAAGGWVNKEVRILSLRHDLTLFQTTVDAILRVPAEY